MKRRSLLLGLAICFLMAAPAVGYVINDWWLDDWNIVIDNALDPPGIYKIPAEEKLFDWNMVDTTDGSHPFRIRSTFSGYFSKYDFRNTLGFLDASGLKKVYGLTYDDALAWTACSSLGRMFQCDIMLDPLIPWSTSPDDNWWFQSTVLHEAGHARGLGHFNKWLSIMNSRVTKLLRGDTLYMDEEVAIRKHSTAVAERDIAIYRKWHDGTVPRWMDMDKSFIHEGETINFYNISIENRGSLPFTTPVTFDIVMSPSPALNTGVTLVNMGTFSSFGTHTYSVFNWSAKIPRMPDCSTQYIGASIPSEPAWGERFVANNTVAFSWGTSEPSPLFIWLARDPGEPNGTEFLATPIPVNAFVKERTLEHDTDDDYYTFTLTSTQSVSILAEFDHSLGNIDLALSGTTLPGTATSTGTTNSERIERILAAGTYYLKVFGVGTGACNRYSLKLASGACLKDLDCDNGTFCNNDRCNPFTRTCVPALPPCDDSNPCTLDFCSELRGGDCLNIPDPAATADPDHDGVCDADDNCPTIYNPGREDLDGDGLGDLCDADADDDSMPDATDCRASHPAYKSPPLPVTDLIWDGSNPPSMRWPSQSQTAGPGTVYDVVMGTSGSAAGWNCAANDLTASSLQVSGVPLPGSILYLLVRAVNGCAAGVGSFGEGNGPSGLAGILDSVSPCAAALCGDGVINPGEQCDDGNTIETDQCLSSCRQSACGDGRILIGVEQCDDGNTAGNDGCSAACLREHVCGDGIVEPGEQCDNGPLNSDTVPDACRAGCKLPVCGDAVTDSGEQCDDGDRFGGDGCSPNCSIEPFCGDGIPGPNEQCDDGNSLDGDGCSSQCFVEVCGNGVIDPGEACDDGNPQTGDGCSPNCMPESTCGNGLMEPGEQCDDGNMQGGDGCSPNCARETPCGDGAVDPGEQCDNGVYNSDFAPDACRSTCVPAHCGDGVTDTGEQCDSGNPQGGNFCSPNCTFQSVCGNGIPEPGELCDDGNRQGGDGCSPNCTFEFVCGNALVEPGEQCDQGALNSNTVPDACRANCTAPRCGDAVTDTWEQCDDGNVSAGDGCSMQCMFEATCGNWVQEPGEQCDDGNTNSGDGCSAACAYESFCGNGIEEPLEECDNGTLNSDMTPDACRTTCLLPRCGDGVVDTGEQCDDGNPLGGDGCSPVCVVE